MLQTKEFSLLICPIYAQEPTKHQTLKVFAEQGKLDKDRLGRWVELFFSPNKPDKCSSQNILKPIDSFLVVTRYVNSI